MITEHTGNIFTTDCETLVNTVNCVGVMGAGIAFEFRLRYPDMFERYKTLCTNGHFNIGSLWIYNADDNKRILNFPTKYDWKQPSKVEYLEKGLQKFLETYKEKNIKSIAFPLLGASHGGLTQQISVSVMKSYLSKVDIPVEIWYYDKEATDDLFLQFKKLVNSNPSRQLSNESGIRIDFIERLKKALSNDDIKTMSGLLRVRGIGEVTLDKSFKFIMNSPTLLQTTLFD